MSDAPETIWAKPGYDEWEIGGWDTHGKAGGTKYRLADLPPVVKPLVWEGGTDWVASSVVGTFRLVKTMNPRNKWHEVNFASAAYGGKLHNTLAEAKAAAQADYTARILSALVTP